MILWTAFSKSMFLLVTLLVVSFLFRLFLFLTTATSLFGGHGKRVTFLSTFVDIQQKSLIYSEYSYYEEREEVCWWLLPFVVIVMSQHEDYTPRRIGEWPTDCQLGEEAIYVPLVYMSNNKNEHGILLWGKSRYSKTKDGKLIAVGSS